MIEIIVHTQKLLSGRIDVKCPSCRAVTAHYHALSITKQLKICQVCNIVLPDSVTIYRDAATRINWHFYKEQLVTSGMC